MTPNSELRALAEKARDTPANDGTGYQLTKFMALTVLGLQHDAIITVLDANAALAAALRDLRFLSKQQGESFTDAVERIADRFYRERGMLAPGKSQPLAFGGSPSDEERRAAYDEWLAAFQQRADAALALAEKQP